MQRRIRERAVVVGSAFAALLLLSWSWQTDPQRGPSEPSDEARASSPSLRIPGTAVQEGSSASLADNAPALAPSHAAYLDDRIMLRVQRDMAFTAVAREHGARIARLPGPSGYGSLLLPAGMDRSGFLAELRSDERVLGAGVIGIMHGASEGLPVAWHLEVLDGEDALAAEQDFSALVVAMLDSGVAYEDYDDGVNSYVQASGLADVLFVEPWDFVNGDAHANDDHQHGTHIASIIASQGEAAGVAPGVSLMPLKVLDQDNSGNELDLIDAIWHAVDHEADVINMSLSFSEGYALSSALDEALCAAWDAGIVLVAAAGNEGAEHVTYPAAQRHVFAVGATSAKDRNYNLQVSDYTNASPRVDLMAPGGSVSEDLTDDGYVDGVLAETIDYQDPSSLGWWFFAGTSQAAAMISGAAVHLLSQGADNHEVYSSLTYAGDTIGSEIRDGYGRGELRLDQTLSKYGDGKASQIGDYYVSLLPWLMDKGDRVEPQVLITLLDANGDPVSGKDVYGSFQGSNSKAFKCGTDSAGQCEANSDAIERYDESGQELALAWTVQADAVCEDKVIAHPGSAFFTSDALEILLAAMWAEGSGIATSPMGIHFPPGPLDPLGEQAESYVFLNQGTGIATSPMGIIGTPPAIEPFANQSTLELDLDGTGIATSPMGVIQLPIFTFDGTGIATSPMGIVAPVFPIFEGTGIATSPMGFTPIELLDPLLPTYDDPGLASDGIPVLGGASADPLGESLQAVLDAGGWTVAEGYAGATALQGSGVICAEAEQTGVAGAGAGAATY